MMMERPKPTKSLPNEREQPSRGEPATIKEESKTMDPIEMLERRLAKLGGQVPAPAVTKEQEEPASATAVTAPSETVLTQQQDAATMNKMALLKRIQEGRERARLAQLKMKEENDELERQLLQHENEEKSVGQEEEGTRNMPPPPSYDEIETIIEPSGHEQSEVSLKQEGDVEEVMIHDNIPSAPPAEDDYSNLYTTAQYPSIEDSHVSSGAAFDYDAFGNLITMEEKQRMENEQREIFEMIERENAKKLVQQQQQQQLTNDSSTRSSVKVSHVLPTTRASSVPSSISTISNSMPQVVSGLASSVVVAAERRPFRMVNVGSGRQVQVYDQTKTKEAIENGTAVLVECVSCSQWMQVTESAKLMYCPCCEVVVPVVLQNSVKTREEAIRLTQDRQLAEKLQNEFRVQTESAAIAASAEQSNELTFSSWREYVSAIFFASPATTEQQDDRNSQSQPSTMLTYPAEGRSNNSGQQSNTRASIESVSSQQRQPSQLRAAQVYGYEGTSNDEEAAGLLPARVADPQPNLLSCVEKSFSTVVSSIGRLGYGEEEKEVDEELLALTNRDMLLREETATSSEYHRLLDYEDDR